MIYAGIDIGSITAKAAPVEGDKILCTKVIKTGYDHVLAGKKVFKSVLEASGCRNDKCAAGTGRFMEVMANALDLDLEQFGQFGLQSENPSKISAICTVFAESEVISMIAGQQKREDIIAGIHASAAGRVAILARKIKLKPPVMMTGGVGAAVQASHSTGRAMPR